jgi:multidrug efflux pump subunit AcrA (membrane-fusion protein)
MGSGFRTGMFARASMKTPPSPAYVVPAKAIAYRDGKAGVFSVNAQNVVAFHPVDTGERMNDEVEIVSGVKDGEQIVVTGAGLLEDGDRVDVVSEQAQNTHLRLSE